jgi:uracil-DNA glycosylase family 4
MTASREESLAALNWLLEAGADEAVSEVPIDRFSARATPALAPSAQHQPRPAARPNLPLAQIKPTTLAPLASDGFGSAMEIAGGCGSLSDLKKAMERFEGSQLKKLATNTVFADGNPNGGIMLIGEAPGYDEDKAGLPFVGRAGKLLDKMLASIGLDRTRVYIINVMAWRPPDNRNPDPSEVALCIPFLRRHIELASPKILVMLGAVSARHVLGLNDGIMKLRGRWLEYRIGTAMVPVLPTLHPAYLLRQPAHKKLAWRDLQALADKLDALGLPAAAGN